MKLNENKKKNAEKMIKKHDAKRNKTTYEFNVGDLVSVAILRIDRSGVEFSRLPGMICRIGGGNNEIKISNFNCCWYFK